MTSDTKYSRRIMLNFTQQLEAPWSRKQKATSAFFIAFLKCALNLEHFEKKDEYSSLWVSYIKFRTFWWKNMSLIVSVFPKVLTPKEVVTGTSKAPCFRTPFGNQRVHEFQTLSKSARHHYYPIVPWIWDKLSWKKCRLVRFEILELFVNTLTTDDKYSSRNIQNLTQQLQTTMSQKQKTFYRIFITYVKSRTSSDDFV